MTFEIPGLGEIEVKDRLSDELMDRIKAEAILIAEKRMGIVLKARPDAS